MSSGSASTVPSVQKASLGILLALAMPMVLSRATQSVSTFADALMVEHHGPDAIAASATGGFNVFLFMILPMGMVFIVQSFVAQLVGRGDRDMTPRYAWYAMIIAAISAVIGIALIPSFEPLLALSDYSPEVQAQMTDYMTIRMFSVFAVVAVEALGNWYGGLGNTWMSMIANVISMVVDITGNWLLIDGNLGFPAMGVNGAALSTTIGSWAGFAFIALAFWQRRGDAPRGGRLVLSGRELGRVVRFGLPNGINWFLEFAAFQMFINVVIADLGDTSVAALNVVIAINSVSFMPAFGLASAGAILAGQAIGAGAKDNVWPHVKLTLACTAAWMGVIGLLYLLLPSHLIELFDSQGKAPQLVSVGVTMLALSAAWQLFDSVGITLSETLRAAGDTTWTALVRLVLAWGIFFPSAYLIVTVYGGGATGAMLCLVAYVAILASAFAYRFRSGAWKKIELIEPKLV